jgi:hypothetical protein
MNLKLRWPILGVALIAVGSAMSDFGAEAAPKEPTDVCEYNKAKTSLQIRDTSTDQIKAQLDNVVELKDRVATGHGAIIVADDHIIETGIQFKADFTKRSCSVGHVHDSWGSETVTAPMAENVQSLKLVVN